jgi:S-DNA-T family DNA segregation ATPase FtsK/SpoIIIE
MGLVALLLLLGTLVSLIYLSKMREVFLRRVTSIFLITLGLFLLLSFVSFRGEGTSNLGGIVGHYVALFFLSNLGYITSLGLSLLLPVSAFLFLRNSRGRDISWKGGFFLLFLMFFSSEIALFHRGDWLGSVNLSMSSLLSRFLSKYGATLFLIFLMAVSLIPLLPTTFFKGFLRRERRVRRSPPEKKKNERKPIGTVQGASPKPIPVPSQEVLISLLEEPREEGIVDKSECEAKARAIEEKLREFDVEGKVVRYHPGPVVTRFEFEPAPGVKLSKILSLADDLAMRMRAHKIRIEAPLPGKGLIGIEVPNERRRIVTFKEMVDRETFKSLKSKLAFTLGVDTAGHPVYADLSKMPHLLIAGATGSGKSVCINAIIGSILFKSSPREVRFLMIDPKRVELSYYEGIPHLIRPVVLDPREAVYALREAVHWMEERYNHFSKDGVRDIESHNSSLARRGDEEPIPYIVIIIDEFGDLITTMSKDVEEPLARLAQMARAVGIHLVVATQRPSVKVITGTIKTNFPVRIAFKVPSRTDSRVILDEIGAEKLLGRGDMLFIPPGTAELKRLHGPLITEDEIKRIAKNLTTAFLFERFTTLFGKREGIKEVVEQIVDGEEIETLTRKDLPGLEDRFERVVDYIASRLLLERDQVREKLEELRESYYPPISDLEVSLSVEVTEEGNIEIPEGYDPLLKEAARLIVSHRIASATLLQRKMKIGFARAARILDQLEELGIVGPPEGSKPREVLVGPETLEEKLRSLGS